MGMVDLIIQGIAAVGSVLAAFAAWQALKIASQANELAEKTATESADHVRESNRLAQLAAEQAEQHARDSEKREELRDQRRMASNLQAWWVKKASEDTNAKEPGWGIILSNAGPEPSVFHDICLKLTCNSNSLHTAVKMLPPGTYFLESFFDTRRVPSIKFPQSVDNLQDFEPIINSKKHTVDEITYMDQVGQKWRWTREDGLTAI